jgi:hypothetical protein
MKEKNIIDFDYSSLYPSLMKSIRPGFPQNHLGIEEDRKFLRRPERGPANHIIVSQIVAEILNNIQK